MPSPASDRVQEAAARGPLGAPSQQLIRHSASVKGQARLSTARSRKSRARLLREDQRRAVTGSRTGAMNLSMLRSQKDDGIRQQNEDRHRDQLDIHDRGHRRLR